MTDPVSNRQLNRTFLVRQLVNDRANVEPGKALEHLLGLQAQAPMPPYIALWTRLTDFDPHALSDLIENKSAVRVAAMRSTVHLLLANDCFSLRALTQGVIERATISNHGKTMGDVPLAEIAKQTKKILKNTPLSTAKLGIELQRFWPDVSSNDLTMLARAAVTLVQVPPRGLWGQSGAPTVLLADYWLSRPQQQPESLEQVIVRYLRAFGPAGVMDFQAWSGLTRTKTAFESLGDKLKLYKSESGKLLYDVRGLRLAGEDDPAPLRFLGDYDNATLSHADRIRIISDENRRRLALRNGQVPGVILIDGLVQAMWRLARTRRQVTLNVTPFVRIAKPTRAAIDAEGERLLAFLAPEATHAISVKAG